MVQVIGQYSSTVYSIIFVHSFLRSILALYCRNCTRIGRLNSGIETECHTDCEGDVCGIVHWRDKDTIHIYESCISGVDLSGIKMGCRRNNAGATLCLCRDFHECNDIAWQEKLAQMLYINLSDLDCYEANANDTSDFYNMRKCRANFCLYEHHTGTYSDLESFGCSKPSQHLFDINLSPGWPMLSMFPSECFLIETDPGNPVLRCMCNEDNCNGKPVDDIQPGNVSCAVYDLGSSGDKGDSCNGDYCFIQRSYPPYFETQELRGCLSVNDLEYSKRIKTGYHNIMGLEQWLCTDNLCNEDIDAAEKSARISASAVGQLFRANISTKNMTGKVKKFLELLQRDFLALTKGFVVA
uniref:Activin_recp domain-containing protein n=1 Tax=Syphacia muris TaxID=451379 RepID=A0A0N5AEH8_9BILA